jgi:hypothetical protein
MFDDEAFVASGKGRVAQGVDLTGVASRRFVDEGAVVQVVRADFVFATLGRCIAECAPWTVVRMNTAWKPNLFLFYTNCCITENERNEY